MIDFLIIGGGVVGTFLARELSHYEGTTLLVEKEDDFSQIQTTHNSALVHSPVVTPPSKGELKSRLSREGNAIYHALSEKLDVPVKKNGAMMVIDNHEDEAELRKMIDDARERGIEEVAYLSREEALAMEPNLSDDIVGAMHMPTAMTADTYALTKAIGANASRHGAQFHFNTEVLDITHDGTAFTIKTSKGEIFKARYVFNAAGVHNATIASMIETSVPYTMTPRRGDYYVLDASQRDFMGHTIFPMPSKKGKGVLIVPQPDGTIRLGPTSIPQDSLDDHTVREAGLREIKENVSTYAKNIPFDHVLRTYAGVRSTIDQKDFFIQPSREVPSFIHVAGIDSPGVTSAPAIAKYVTETIMPKFEVLRKKDGVDPLAQ